VSRSPSRLVWQIPTSVVRLLFRRRVSEACREFLDAPELDGTDEKVRMYKNVVRSVYVEPRGLESIYPGEVNGIGDYVEGEYATCPSFCPEGKPCKKERCPSDADDDCEEYWIAQCRSHTSKGIKEMQKTEYFHNKPSVLHDGTPLSPDVSLLLFCSARSIPGKDQSPTVK
jgi:hypothetical protein